MALAHGVEGRFPFLDHRVFEFAAALPTGSKLAVLREKAILRRWARGVVPDMVTDRPKQPYRAPDAPAFFGPGTQDYVGELLDGGLAEAGIFDRDAVAGLAERCRSGRATGFRENQALVAVLSTGLWHRAFMGGAPTETGALPRPDVALEEGTPVAG